MPTDESLARSRDISPDLLRHAAETETAHRIAPAALRALRDAGLFALPVPVELGGAGAGVSDIVRVLVEIGRGCPASAWVLGTSATSKDFARLAFDTPALSTIFADPAAIFCGSGKPAGTAVRRSGGVEVTGRWTYVSGIEDADAAVLGVMAAPGDGSGDAPTFHQVIVAASELTVERTWDMAGMQGTGSHTVVADALRVPAERVAPVAVRPGFVLASTAYVLGAVLGAARGAEDRTCMLFASGANRSGSTHASLMDSPGARALWAEATLLLDAAVERTLRRCTDLERSAVMTPLDVARTRADFASAAKDALGAVDRMVDLHGTAGMHRSDPVQRFWRDASVGARHALLNQSVIMEAFGSALADPAPAR